MTSSLPASDTLSAGGPAAPAAAARKPGSVLVFVPIAIAAIGLAGLFLGLGSASTSARSTGYGVDEIRTGTIAIEAQTALR